MNPSDPSAQPAELTPEDLKRRSDETSVSRSAPSTGPRPLLKCLIVSHDEDVRSLLDSMLKVRRHSVMTCDHLELEDVDFVEFAPNLAIIDWRLPDGLAQDLVRQIHSDTRLASTCQILAVVDTYTSSEVSTILDSGVCDVLTEPLEPASVEARIRVHEHIAAEFLKLERHTPSSVRATSASSFPAVDRRTDSGTSMFDPANSPFRPSGRLSSAPMFPGR